MLARYLAEGRLVAPFGTGDRSGCAYILVHADDMGLTVAARRVARWIATLVVEDRPAAA